MIPAFSAQPVVVQNLRMWRAPDNTRLVFDLSGEVNHQVFVLQSPHRIVIDLDNAQFKGALPQVEMDNPLLASIRNGRPEGKTLRFVLDLKQSVNPRSLVLRPAGQYGHRLVIDLLDPEAQAQEMSEVEQAIATTPPETPVTPDIVPETAPVEPTPAPALVRRDWVVAIDAGHGGEDPGAIGRKYRTREKDVTLAIARELARQINRENGMRAVLVRDGDYYVGLQSRYMKAKRERADAFVSIHADSLPGKRVAYGSSVFALSLKGSTNVLARALADQENYSDVIGGVDLSDKPPDVVRTLLDLSLDKKIEHSIQMGQDVLTELARIGRVHSPRVAQAGFAVLKEPEIPSILVETAFISTPAEERRLRDPAYQRQMATAILKGVKRYLMRTGEPMAPSSQLASRSPREHVVRTGDTLGSIARQYNVSIDVLRFLNELTSDDVAIGSRLRLPAQDG
jgi:N-acetylmuramoyl-L-alanine amidase